MTIHGLMYAREQVRSCYWVSGGGLHFSLDEALEEADELNTDVGTDEEGRGRAVVVPAMTIVYPIEEPAEEPAEPEPEQPVEEPPADGTSTS